VRLTPHLGGPPSCRMERGQKGNDRLSGSTPRFHGHEPGNAWSLLTDKRRSTTTRRARPPILLFPSPGSLCSHVHTADRTHRTIREMGVLTP